MPDFNARPYMGSDKILAIASAGGHWIELLRLMPAFGKSRIVFVSTHESFSESVPGHTYYNVPDASRWNKFRLIYVGLRVAYIILRVRPHTVISTGAAPGLMGIIVGKLIRSKTIWIDSIANVERISMSGKIALKFTDKFYTQWPHLASSKIIYKGNVIA
jgi:UDP-N-acetylglucosamine:LPS N-acetylglucosamine transferase